MSVARSLYPQLKKSIKTIGVYYLLLVFFAAASAFFRVKNGSETPFIARKFVVSMVLTIRVSTVVLTGTIKGLLLVNFLLLPLMLLV